jgi:hypothetical protein
MENTDLFTVLAKTGERAILCLPHSSIIIYRKDGTKVRKYTYVALAMNPVT